ncbi:MAG: hypothetical protein RIF33_10605 [Cyclobacteriaceae bacterium]
MKKYILAFGMIMIMSATMAQQVTQLWQVTSLESPESVIYAADQQTYYVSNVSGQPAEKNGQGFISAIDKDGNLKKLKWATGFNAPKGLAIYGDLLYVADIDVVAVVNLKTGAIEKKYAAVGSTFLNDVEIAADGTVYITDTFGGNAIYQIKDDQISVWMKSAQLDYPNGLKIEGDQLFVSTWGVVTHPATFGTEIPGRLLSVHMKTQEITEVTKSIGNLDGLLTYAGGYLTTDWISGSLMFVEKSGKTTIVQDLNAGSADIDFGSQPDILLIPQMMDGVLTAYQLK